MRDNKTNLALLPVLFGFFIMGFVDVVVVGISTNYAKQDFNLSDSLANLLPMMVFFMVCCFFGTDRPTNVFNR